MSRYKITIESEDSDEKAIIETNLYILGHESGVDENGDQTQTVEISAFNTKPSEIKQLVACVVTGSTDYLIRTAVNFTLDTLSKNKAAE